MNILYLSFAIDPTNGYGNITYELLTRISRQHHCIVCLPPINYSVPQLPPNIDILEILPPFIPNFKTVKTLQYFTWHAPKGKWDLIHSLFAFPYAMLAAKTARQTKAPLIIGAQGTYGVEPLMHQPEKNFLQQAYKAAKVVHAPSDFTAQHMQSWAQLQQPVIKIHNGVNLSRFQKPLKNTLLKKQFGSGPMLLGVGALKDRKGFDIVINAVVKLKKKYPKLKYLIAGEGGDRSKLQQQIDQLQLQSQVYLLGNTSGDELVRLFQFCDLYVHTPRNLNWNFEGFGIVYLEAAACGKPVIASHSGGVTDAVLDNQTGLLVPENDATATAAAIDRLLSDKKRYQSFAKAGKKWAKAHDWDTITAEYLELYKETRQ